MYYYIFVSLQAATISRGPCGAGALARSPTPGSGFTQDWCTLRKAGRGRPARSRGPPHKDPQMQPTLTVFYSHRSTVCGKAAPCYTETSSATTQPLCAGTSITMASVKLAYLYAWPNAVRIKDYLLRLVPAPSVERSTERNGNPGPGKQAAQHERGDDPCLFLFWRSIDFVDRGDAGAIDRLDAVMVGL